MSVKPIVDIEVNAQAFERFYELYKKYQDALAKSPGMWENVSDAQKELVKNFQVMTAAMLAQNQLAKDAAEEDEHRVKRLILSEKLWTSMARNGQSLAKSVLDIGAGFLRWGAIIGGVATGAGLFGIDRMAEDVADRRRAALGLGSSIGQMRSFDINFGRVADPNFLAMINEMRINPAASSPLYALGVGTQGSSADVAVRALDALYRKARATPEQQLGSLDTVLGTGLGAQAWERLHNTQPGEYAKLRAQYYQGAKDFQLGDSTASKWADLNTQLDRSKEKIFDVLVRGLTPLAPAFDKLSKSLTDLISTALPPDGNGPVQRGILKLAAGIEEFAKYIGTQEFKDKIKLFVSDVGGLADAVHSIVDAYHHPFKALWQADRAVAGWEYDLVTGGPAGRDASAKQDFFNNVITGQAAQFKVPRELLGAQWYLESRRSLDPNTTSPKGAEGIFQFDPKTAQSLGINPRDNVQSAYGAAKLDAGLLKKYHGDLIETLAAYNMGETQFDAAYAKAKKDHKDWYDYVPAETQQYVTDAWPILVNAPGVKVVLHDQTGGSPTLVVQGLQ